jgi:hypothetical protein
MLWLIWIAIMLLVPVGAWIHVWWQLHHAPQEGGASPQPAQLASQVAVSSTDGIPPH